jgi:type II restriction enzyme
VKTPKELIMFECNFYAGGGSKLKSTAEEYESVNNFLKANNFKFVWITDGMGWKTTKTPLQKVFENNDYLINLQMVEEGILKEIVSKI